jgi:hypothetical protein
MSIERSELTQEQVARAEARIEFTHPVLSVIEQHLPAINSLQQDYSKIQDNQEQQRYIREHFGFLADAFVEAGPYTMTPTDIISIWSRAIEVFPSLYQRYRLAAMISNAYAIQGLDNPDWKRFPRCYLETDKLPAEVTHDRKGIMYAKARFLDIRHSLDALVLYVYGTSNPMDQACALGTRLRDGDMTAQTELDKLNAYQEEHKTPVLDEIGENFDNAIGPIRLFILN